MKFTPDAGLSSEAGSAFGFDIQASTSSGVAGLAGGIVHATVTVNDVVDPTTTITVVPVPNANGFVASTNATFEFIGNDDVGVVRFEVSLDGAPLTTATSPVNYTVYRRARTRSRCEPWTRRATSMRRLRSSSGTSTRWSQRWTSPIPRRASPTVRARSRSC